LQLHRLIVAAALVEDKSGRDILYWYLRQCGTERRKPVRNPDTTAAQLAGGKMQHKLVGLGAQVAKERIARDRGHG